MMGHATSRQEVHAADLQPVAWVFAQSQLVELGEGTSAVPNFERLYLTKYLLKDRKKGHLRLSLCIHRGN